MTAIQVDPRVIADALHLELSQLTNLLAGWCVDQLGNVGTRVDFERRDGPLTPDEFDAMIAKARTYLEEAHACYREYLKDMYPAAGSTVHLVEDDGSPDGARGEAATVLDADPDTGLLTVTLANGSTVSIDNWFYPELDDA